MALSAVSQPNNQRVFESLLASVETHFPAIPSHAAAATKLADGISLGDTLLVLRLFAKLACMPAATKIDDDELVRVMNVVIGISDRFDWDKPDATPSAFEALALSTLATILTVQGVEATSVLIADADSDTLTLHPASDNEHGWTAIPGVPQPTRCNICKCQDVSARLVMPIYMFNICVVTCQACARRESCGLLMPPCTRHGKGVCIACYARNVPDGNELCAACEAEPYLAYQTAILRGPPPPAPEQSVRNPLEVPDPLPIGHILDSDAELMAIAEGILGADFVRVVPGTIVDPFGAQDTEEEQRRRREAEEAAARRREEAEAEATRRFAEEANRRREAENAAAARRIEEERRQEEIRRRREAEEAEFLRLQQEESERLRAEAEAEEQARIAHEERKRAEAAEAFKLDQERRRAEEQARAAREEYERAAASAASAAAQAPKEAPTTSSAKRAVDKLDGVVVSVAPKRSAPTSPVSISLVPDQIVDEPVPAWIHRMLPEFEQLGDLCVEQFAASDFSDKNWSYAHGQVGSLRRRLAAAGCDGAVRAIPTWVAAYMPAIVSIVHFLDVRGADGDAELMGRLSIMATLCAKIKQH